MLVVVNPVAGRGRARRMATELESGLRERGAKVELFATAARGDARRRVGCLGSDEVDLVVSVGGDGTLEEVLAGLVREVPVAVLAAGTANVLRQDLGLPRDAPGLLELLEDARLQPLDTARVWVGPGREELLSFLVTGVGFDGEAVRRVAAARRGPITRWAYVRAVLGALFAYRAPELSVELDGRTLPEPCPWVLVANVGGYGGLWRLAPDRRLDDGQFEVYLLRARTRRDLVGYALRGMLSGLPSGDVPALRARHVRITSERPVPVEVDGDAAGTTPVELRVEPARHRLVVGGSGVTGPRVMS